MLTLMLNTFFIGILIFAERRNPAATWAWLMVIAVFPVIGFFIYLLLGQDSRKHRVFLQKMTDDEPCVNANETTQNNGIRIFNNGTSHYDALLCDIEQAKRFIFVQAYILRGDKVGRHFVARLAKRAADGVEVCLLIDGMGCIFTPKAMFKPLKDAGGKVGVFLPPVPVRVNYRNHRKLTVVDGRCGYIGGLNLGSEYLGMSKRFGMWRDTHARIDGEAVKPMTLRFLMDWNFAAKDKLPIKDSYFATPPPAGRLPIQIVSSGPDTRLPNILHGFCKIISQAKKSVYIQTPYFVPDESLVGALRVAAWSGVDVRVMFPANPDHPFVYWAGLSYLGELMDVGVRAYEYTNGFLHAKTVMADGCVCAIGSANIDVRSFKINFETTAFIYNRQVTKQLEDAFFDDMRNCRQITPELYAGRKRVSKIKESVSRLFAPLL